MANKKLVGLNWRFTIRCVVTIRESLLSGGGYGELKSYKPTTIQPLSLTRKRTRYAIGAGTQLKSNTKTTSLEAYKQSYLGSIHKIWAKLPQSLVNEGEEKSWQSIRGRAKTVYGRQMVTKDSHPEQDEQNQESATREPSV